MNHRVPSRLELLGRMLVLGGVISCSILIDAADETMSVPAPPGLVSWWRGEGNARDSVGEANGVLYRGVTFAQGKVGRCFAFDGISSGINVPDVPSLALTDSLTIECWLFVSQAPLLPGMVLFRGDTRSGLDPYFVSLEPEARTSGVLHFVVWGEDNINAVITAPMPIGSWTHVAATLQVDNCTSRMTLYTNALVAAQMSTRVRPLGALDPDFRPGLGIGNHSSQPGPFNYPFHGLIDELT